MSHNERKRSGWPLVRRILLALVTVLVVSVAGFESWRQSEIAKADRKVVAAVGEIEVQFAGTPRFDKWLRSLGEGSNGDVHFVANYVRACEAYEFTDDMPVLGIDWHGWNLPGERRESLDESGLRKWLAESQGIADAFSGLLQFDHVTLDPKHPALLFEDNEIATSMFFAMVNADVVADRVASLVQLGQTARALQEFAVVCEVASKLGKPGCQQQLIFLTAFAGFRKELQWRLAADNLLTPADYSMIEALEPDPELAIATACTGALLRVMEADHDEERESAWFGWLGPGNYEDWSGDEVIRLTLLYPHERRALAHWIRYSLEWLKVGKAGNEPPSAPDDIELLHHLLHWNEQLNQLRGTAPQRDWIDLIMSMRRKQHAGADLEEIRQMGRSGEHIEVTWNGAACTLRYRHSEPVWRALGGQEHESLPEPDDFYGEHPPATMRFD